MKTLLSFCTLLTAALPALAQPTQAQLFELNNSIVQVIVDLNNGRTGSGSGAVIDQFHVATNCHVLADSRGVAITKFQDNYNPYAIKADWKHDLCLLKFNYALPFKPVSLRDSASLQYEEPVFAISYPNDTPVPQPSYGSVKAIYPYDGSVIVRTNAAFALGSSGGALFDQDFNLIGVTTFKSPGRNGYFYNLPVEWIKRLLEAPDTLTLNSQGEPFWSFAEEDRPYFMRVVIPFQQRDWPSLKSAAMAWQSSEPDNAEAYYYLGSAELKLGETDAGLAHLRQAIALNPRHLDALIRLGETAVERNELTEAEAIRARIAQVDVDEADNLAKRIKP